MDLHLFSPRESGAPTGLLARTTSHPASHPSGRHVKGWTQSVVQHASFGVGEGGSGTNSEPRRGATTHGDGAGGSRNHSWQHAAPAGDKNGVGVT